MYELVLTVLSVSCIMRAIVIAIKENESSEET